MEEGIETKTQIEAQVGVQEAVKTTTAPTPFSDIVTEPTEKKKRGRPKGRKDGKPRKTRCDSVKLRKAQEVLAVLGVTSDKISQKLDNDIASKVLAIRETASIPIGITEAITRDYLTARLVLAVELAMQARQFGSISKLVELLMRVCNISALESEASRNITNNYTQLIVRKEATPSQEKPIHDTTTN